MESNPKTFHSALKRLESCSSDNRYSESYRSYSRQYNCCEVCGKETQKNPEPHHILPVRFDNDYINDEDNLVALCSRCHHSVDNNRHLCKSNAPGDKEQKWRFEEFKEYTEDKRSKMMEKVVQDGKNRDLIKILMYEDKV